jgi:hypothetical protein
MCAGDPEWAGKLMADIRERGSKRYVSPACFGVYQAALGHGDRMFEYLRGALDERDPYLTRMDAEPCFEPFRSDPRYSDLLSRMNLD